MIAAAPPASGQGLGAGWHLSFDGVVPADAARIVAIDAAVAATGWSPAALEADLLRPDRTWLVARATRYGSPNGRRPVVVGFAGFALLADEAHVLAVAVDPAWQRRGVGRRLMAALERSVRSAGVLAMTLEVAVDNDEARRLYRRAGFVDAGVRPGYYSDGRDAVIAWKRWSAC